MNPCPLAGDQGSLPLDDGLWEVVRAVGFEPTLPSASGWGLCQVGLRAVVAGVVGIEPTISWLRTRRLCQLGHTPFGGSCRTRTEFRPIAHFVRSQAEAWRSNLLRAKQALFQPELRTRCGEVYGIRTRVLVIDSDPGTARLP